MRWVSEEMRNKICIGERGLSDDRLPSIETHEIAIAV